VAEVLVKPEDIAAIKEGDKAELKVTAYDFSKDGKIKVEVTDISPTTLEQEDKRYYYKVHIRFNPNRSDRFAAVWRLQPGMTVDADIISGSESLLQYLLKPIYRGWMWRSPSVEPSGRSDCLDLQFARLSLSVPAIAAWWTTHQKLVSSLNVGRTSSRMLPVYFTPNLLAPAQSSSRSTALGLEPLSSPQTTTKSLVSTGG
jgi:hypothetical protein